LKRSARKEKKEKKDYDDQKQARERTTQTQRQVASADYLSIPRTHLHKSGGEEELAIMR
jgi:hypothetical protein